jgi:DNA processing protein
MTLDEAVALSLIPELPRVGLSDRLRAGDPVLLDIARAGAGGARAVRTSAESAGIQALAWDDPRFPAALLATSDVPPLLWYRGTLQALGAPAVAVVGSRAATAVALETAERLAADLAARGITVVSGLARGVDSAAHRGALRNGRTIAVLGSGLDRIYPAEHAALAADIARDGLVVSEYPPGTTPLPFHFPMRNRIISGLSRAVVVIEANEKSGSLITAACALEQGREVMAVPGNVLSGRNRGAHALIRDGAKIVECADDIVEELCCAPSAATPANQPSSAHPSSTSGDPLLRVMEEGHDYDLDALASASGVAGVRLLPRLLELELAGLVQRVGGGRFRRQIRTC